MINLIYIYLFSTVNISTIFSLYDNSIETACDLINLFITCSPKIPPHIKNDGLGSFRRIGNDS